MLIDLGNLEKSAVQSATDIEIRTFVQPPIFIKSTGTFPDINVPERLVVEVGFMHGIGGDRCGMVIQVVENNVKGYVR